MSIPGIFMTSAKLAGKWAAEHPKKVAEVAGLGFTYFREKRKRKEETKDSSPEVTIRDLQTELDILSQALAEYEEYCDKRIISSEEDFSNQIKQLCEVIDKMEDKQSVFEKKLRIITLACTICGVAFVAALVLAIVL